jgi:predicted small secreted protein
MNDFIKGAGLGIIAGVTVTAMLAGNKRFTRDAMRNAEKAKQAISDMFDSVGYVFHK